MRDILSPNQVSRRFVTATGGLIVALMLAVALPSAAHADAWGCTWSTLSPRSCVSVVGSLSSIRGGVEVSPHQTVRGHFRVYGRGFSSYTRDATYQNQSLWHWTLYWGDVFAINKPLPSGTKVCAAFYDLTRGWRAPACETIG
jgi:hypothetical protein